MRVLSLTLLVLACAAEDSHPIIIVTADRSESDRWRTPTATSVSDADAMRRLGSPIDQVAHLGTLPGVDTFRAGGGLDGGGFPALRLRGTANNHDNAILVDGIPWADASTIGTDPQLAGMDLAGIERWELARGPQSGLYGGRAIGGVVNVLTARPTDAHAGSLTTQAGSFTTLAGAATATGPLLREDGRTVIGYALSASGVQSEGFSTTVTGQTGDPEQVENDRLWRNGINGRVEVHPTQDLTLYAAAWLGSAYHAYDVVNPDDTESWSRQWHGRIAAGGSADLGNGGRIAFDIARSRSDREETDPFSGTTVFAGETDYASARVLIPVTDQVRVQTGLDLDRQFATYQAVGDQSQSDLGAWAQLLAGQEWWEGTAVLRYDHLSGSEDGASWKLGGAVFPRQDVLKIHATLGTAYRAPSLDDQFATYFFPGFPPFFPDYSYSGNPGLEPQRSLGWDFGVGLQDDTWNADVTAFGTHYDNRSTYVEDTSDPTITHATLINEASSSRSIGIESALTWTPAAPWWSRMAVTWQDSEDENGKTFINLPEWKGAWLLGWQAKQWWTTLTWQLVGSRRARNDEHLPGYGTVDLAAGYQVVAWGSVFVRGENLLDRGYVEGVTFTPNEYYAGAPQRVSLGVELRY